MRRALLLVAVAALAVMLVPVAQASADDGYDVVIYEASDGSTHIQRGGSDEVLASGSAVVSSSEVDGSYSVIMRSGSLDSLTVLSMNGGSDSVSVSFVMESGSIGSLTGISAATSASEARVDMFSMEIRGHVTELDPCDSDIAVGKLVVTVGQGGSVDRLRSTGSAGTVSSASVRVMGGSVGYMANGSAEVQDLEYELMAGTVDYLCLGSDTQSSGSSLSSVPAFRAAGSISVRSTSSFAAGTAILGAGVLVLPSVLPDGSAAPSYSSRVVVLDAPNLEFSDAMYFASGARALTFSSYTIGGTPDTSPLRTSVSRGPSDIQLYGDGGVWGSDSGGTVSDLSSVYLNTTLTVGAGSVLEVSPNGFLTNARFLRVQGTLVAAGLVDNAGVVELDGGTLEGGLSGDGFVAVSVTADVVDLSVGAMSSLDAIVVRAREGGFLEARVYMAPTGASVVVSSSEPLDAAVVGVSQIESDSGEGFEVYVAGYSGGSVVSVTATVTVPFRTESGESVWVLGPDGGEADVLDVTEWEVTFAASSRGVYTVTTEAPEEDSSQIWMDAVIVVVIVVLAAFIVYELLRRDRA